MEKYTTHITFVDGTQHREDPVTADKVGSTITRLCDGPAALMGIIKSAIVVDSGDCVVVEIKGRDITFPPQLAQQQAAFRKAQKSSK
jgi:hypothetical protein